MKKCNFAIEACLGIPYNYDNWYEYLEVELTDEQFDRYCKTLENWNDTDEWKNWNNENGENYFINRDLPDIYQLIIDKLNTYAPQIWDERIIPFLDQINLYTANEIWESAPSYKAINMEWFTIPTYLKEIEKEYDVKILLAVESGSRAWGFESKDSDWDVRFIYVHRPDWYFRVIEQRNVIEKMMDDGADIVGWELRKALTLLMKSNTSMLEWFNSPKVYYIDREFAERIHKIEKDFFNPIRAMYHYNHIYNKHNERYLQRENCNIKRFLYFLRGVLACKWIEQHMSLPPVNFSQLVDAVVDDINICNAINALIKIKKSSIEHDMTIIDSNLIEYTNELANHYNQIIDTFRPQLNIVSTDALDSILYDMVHSQNNKQ